MSRGFTGHEHDDAVGLINMRGRVYDPRLARFLTTDPLIGDPAHSQAWNPYSYVMNAPLDFIDPSGFDPEYITFEDHHVHVDRGQAAAERSMQQMDTITSRMESGAGRGTASTQPGAASGSGPGSVLSDLGSLAGAYGQGFVEGVVGMAEGGLRLALESGASPVVTGVYRNVTAYQNFGQGNIGTGILDVASAANPVVALTRVQVEGLIGLYDMGEHTADTLANGSAEDVARLAGQLTPPALAAIAAGRLSGSPSVRAAVPETASQATVLGEGAAGGQGAFSRVLSFTRRNLQKGFTKHGADFGMTGNWNPS